MPIQPHQVSNILIPGYTSGRYYTTPFIHNTITQQLSANNVYYFPMWVATRIGISGIAARVTTAATGTCRLGVYDNNNGIPNKLILDAGTIDTSSTGAKEITLSTTFLNPGWYWMALFAGINATFDSTNGFISTGLIGNTSVSVTQVTGLRATLTYAAFPTTATLASLLYSSSVPLLWIKIA